MDRGKRRKIHIDLPEEIHRKLRVKAALNDVSLNSLVASVLSEAVKDVELPEIVAKYPKKMPKQGS